jgi:hypothetical protein
VSGAGEHGSSEEEKDELPVVRKSKRPARTTNMRTKKARTRKQRVEDSEGSDEEDEEVKGASDGGKAGTGDDSDDF